MKAATTYPARRDDVRLLVVDPDARALREARTPALPDFLAAGDLLVVNDAATLPASLRGRVGRSAAQPRGALRGGAWGPSQGLHIDVDVGRSAAQPRGALRGGAWGPSQGPHIDVDVGRSAAQPRGALRGGAWGPSQGPHIDVDDGDGRPIEARLVAARGGARFAAVLLGAGDWHARTEDRPPPPVLPIGATLHFGALAAEIVGRDMRSPRLVEVEFAATGDELWSALYREGRPVQYSYLAHDLPLWAVQTVYAARPWAFEMPSAGRPLSWETLLALRRKGVRWASLTHAAGPSSTGDPAIDAALPLAERYDIPAATVRAVNETRARGGRVVAVGTTVVRALEGAAARDGVLRPGSGETDLVVTPTFRPRVVDGILSGAHAASESHFRLLAAFAGPALLDAAAAHAERAGFLTHELGDSMLVLPGALGGGTGARRVRGYG